VTGTVAEQSISGLSLSGGIGIQSAMEPPVTPSAEMSEKPLSTGEWLVTLLVLALPVIGLVMHFVWAFGAGNIGRRNFCRATLIMIAVVFGLMAAALVGFLVLGGTMAALLSNAHR